MIKVVGIYAPSASAAKPEEELLAAFTAAGVSATVQGAGVSAGSGERDVEVWADCTEDRAWQLIDGLPDAAVWDIDGELPEGYEPGDELV